jgi:hypothetical protein
MNVSAGTWIAGPGYEHNFVDITRLVSGKTSNTSNWTMSARASLRTISAAFCARICTENTSDGKWLTKRETIWVLYGHTSGCHI